MSEPSTNVPAQFLEDVPLSLDADQLAFFKARTGIDDEGELKQHIMAIQAKALKVIPYPCIRSYSFTTYRIARLPFYKRVLQLAEERKDAILVDVGCCLGHELRKIAADGWPAGNMVGFDLVKEFWDYGHELFRDTPETFPASFVAGDIFDPAMIAPRTPFYTSTELIQTRPDLKPLVSLTHLQGHASVVSCSAFFHLFDEAKQLQVARQIATLLSPLPGSIIIGGHVGYRVKGTRTSHVRNREVFCHSPESWKELWEEVFKKGTVEVEVSSREVEYRRSAQTESRMFYWLSWIITRL
ncbi:hypothetical protein AX15_004796 [Amanita polypyramis BW_CC]|nr:hypothetical protein AX15_004796 [Amanita polypyramis BW_CC]